MEFILILLASVVLFVIFAVAVGWALAWWNDPYDPWP